MFSQLGDMSIFYILIFLLLLQAIIIPQKNRQGIRAYLIIAFVELQIVSGLRLPLAGDTENYTNAFVDISNLSLAEVLNYGYEKGFMFFLYLVSFISSKPQSIIFFSSLFLNILILNYIYKKSKAPWLSVIFYVTLMFFFNGMTVLRSMMACSILLYSNDYIVKRKLIKFLIILFVASSFHFSTIIYGVVYFLYPMQLKLKNFVFIATPLILLSFVILPILQIVIQIHPRFTSYAEVDFYQSAYANVLEFLFNLFIFLFFAYCHKWKLKEIVELEKLYMWLAYLSVVFAFMSINVMIIIRFVTLCSLIFVVYITNVIKEMPMKRRQRWIMLFLFVTITKMVVILTYRPEWFFGEPFRHLLF